MNIVPRIVSTRVVAFHESSPENVLQEYDVAGVRLARPALLFLYVSFVASDADPAATGLSKMNVGLGASPAAGARHGKYGPGLALTYQSFHVMFGASTFPAAEFSVVAKMLSPALGAPPTHGFRDACDLYLQPFAMCASLIGAADVPTDPLAFWSNKSEPRTKRPPVLIRAWFWMHRLPFT